MPKAGKNYKKAAASLEDKLYSLDEAVPLLKSIAFAKFNETVEVSMKHVQCSLFLLSSMSGLKYHLHQLPQENLAIFA